MSADLKAFEHAMYLLRRDGEGIAAKQATDEIAAMTARLALAEVVCIILYDHIHKPESVDWLAVYMALNAWHEETK